jgi:hypothetical protein
MNEIRLPYKLKSCINSKKIICNDLLKSNNDLSISIIEQNIHYLDRKKLKELCTNSKAIFILEKVIDKLDNNYFIELCKNLNAIYILEKYFDKIEWKIDWFELSKNSKSFKILDNNPSKINIHGLLYNEHNIYFLEKYYDNYFSNKIDHDYLYNISDKIDNIFIYIIEKNIDKLDYHIWYKLSYNTNAISILEKNIDKIIWHNLCENINAISILEKNTDKFDNRCWICLSSNPNAISILEKNIDKIDWFSLESFNKNGFKILQYYPDKIKISKINWNNLLFDHPIIEIDYKYLEKRCNIYKEELMQKALHPKRIEKYLLEYGIIIEKLDNYI